MGVSWNSFASVRAWLTYRLDKSFVLRSICYSDSFPWTYAHGVVLVAKRGQVARRTDGCRTNARTSRDRKAPSSLADFTQRRQDRSTVMGHLHTNSCCKTATAATALAKARSTNIFPDKLSTRISCHLFITFNLDFLLFTYLYFVCNQESVWRSLNVIKTVEQPLSRWAYEWAV